MNELLDTVFLDNTLLDYTITAAVILVVLVLNKILSRLVAQAICRLFQRNWKSFDQQTFIDLVLHPLSHFLTITIALAALYRLTFPSALNITLYKFTLAQVFRIIGTVIIILAFVRLLLRSIDFIARILEKRATATLDQSDNQLILFFKDLLKVVIAVIGLLMILRFAFDYNISSLLTGLSIVGAAIALALRESLENLIASFVIFFDKPFTTGDLVKVQGITGNVERIGLRSTRIRTEQKTYVTVPNKQMVDSILDNLSLRSQRKNDLLLNLSLQTSSIQVESLMEELRVFLGSQEELTGAGVLLEDVNAQAIVLHVDFTTLPIEMTRFNQLKQELNLFAIQTLERLEIRIAGALAPAPSAG